MSQELTQKQSSSYTPEQLALITRTVAQGATPDELKMFLHVCKKTKLDPFMRQIHFIKRGGKATIQTGIDGYRAIADRSGKYAGNDEPVFDYKEGGKLDSATVTVYKIIEGQRCGFTASAYWDEYKPQDGQDFMWKKMPHVMLGKVAEALALRKAFPNDLSGLYTNDEMAQSGTSAPIDDTNLGSGKNSLPNGNSGSTQGSSYPPSEKQLEWIANLMEEKGYSKADLMDNGFKPDELTGGRGGTASELIDFLKKAQPKSDNEGLDYPVEELPTIQVDPVEMAKDIDY